LIIERNAFANETEVLDRLKGMGFTINVGEFESREREEPHWHRIEVVIAALEGSFELYDGSVDETCRP
jgi:hypothetical protein